MDLRFSEEQSMLRDMVRRLCEEHAPLARLRELEGTEPGYSAALWRNIGELGLTGITLGETYGGLGMGALDGVIVSEEFGRALAVSPHHISSVLAAGVIARIGKPEHKNQWLSDIAVGDKYVTVASSEPSAGTFKNSIRLMAEPQSNAITLSGEKQFVPFATEADAILVLARSPADKIQVFLLPRELIVRQSDSLRMIYQINHARDPLYKLQFDGFSVPVQYLLNVDGCAWSAWQQCMRESIIPIAAYAVGAAERVHEVTVEYAKFRKAFGRPIGGFQAIAHYLADMSVAINGARTLVHQAAWTLDQQRNVDQLARMAKLQACETFRRAAALCIQVHGGIGYTSEADPQLFFRRAKQMQSLHWDSKNLEDQIANQLFAESI